MKKIILSYTTINNYHISHHSWLNKMLGVKVPETEAMTSGKVAHQIIQAHCLGKKKSPRLSELTWDFTDAEKHILKPYNEKFTLHGYLDLINYASKTIGEIKTSKTPWSQSRFNELVQWKYYSLVSGFRKVLFITCKPDLSGLKTFYTAVSDEDIREAEKWVKEAIVGIEGGHFKEDLTPDGFCNNPMCPYKENCHFRI